MTDWAHEALPIFLMEMEHLKTEAEVLMVQYKDAIGRHSVALKSLSTGLWPRIRPAPNGEFYIYWDKFRMEGGKVGRAKSIDGRSFRTSNSVRKRKSTPSYPASSFKPFRPKAWELEIILQFEEKFESIRIQVTHLAKVIKLTRNAPERR